jgi:hypothetical protein
MEHISISLYQFDELPGKVQNRVIEKQRDRNVRQYWDEFIIDGWKERLEACGFCNPEIMCSGFSCQGDGACFTCDEIDFAKYTDRLIMQTNSYDQAKWLQVFALLYDKGLVSAKIKHVGQCCHEYSTDLYSEYLGQSEDVWQRFVALLADIETRMVQISKAIHKDLEAENDYLTSDSAIRESLMDDNMKFLENGSVWA